VLDTTLETIQFADVAVERYRRTNESRLGDWLPVDSTWKTAASAGLVAHDIYHHFPSDTGSYAQEVAALGAEWYVDLQPLDEAQNSVSARNLDMFLRGATDNTLNVLDAKEKTPFLLKCHTVKALAGWEMDIFHDLAAKVHDILLASDDPRARLCGDFQHRFIQTLLTGYEQARARFPDQKAARVGRENLIGELANLDVSDVPYGHDVTIKLVGYECVVAYTDADADFLSENKVIEGVMMIWHTCESGYPAKEATIHPCIDTYLEYVDEHFMRQDPSEVPEEERLVPYGETNTLHRVYVASEVLQEKLAQGQSVKLDLKVVLEAEATPRGVLII
jgi:hypothetical protein